MSIAKKKKREKIPMKIKISDIKKIRLTWTLRGTIQSVVFDHIKKNFNNDEVNRLSTSLKTQILEDLIEKYPRSAMDNIQHFLPMSFSCKKRIYLYPSLLYLFYHITPSDVEKIIDYDDFMCISRNMSGRCGYDIRIRDYKCNTNDLCIGEIDLPYPMCGVLSDSVLIWEDYIILASNGKLWSKELSQLFNSLVDAIITRLQINQKIITDYKVLIERARTLYDILYFLPETIIQDLIDSQVLTLKGRKLETEKCCETIPGNVISKDVLDRLSSFC